MNFRIPLIATFALGLLLPVNHAAAEKWYHSEWFVGSSGLLIGGLVGYELGRQDRPSRSYRQVEYVAPCSPTHLYAAPGYSYGGVQMTGATYREETRVWPFYRKTRIYPIARTTPIQFTAQNPSMAEYAAMTGYGQERAVDEPSATKGVTVNIGDNNSGVNINIGGAPVATTKGEARRQEANYEVEPAIGRLSERKVDVPTE